MDESRRRGGGGAVTAVSKKPAGAAYGDAFGGVPRFAAPFSPSLVDYAEIFGDVAGSCSIPFLDLPPASDGRGAGTLGTRGAGFDYSEVFGGLDFGELAAPYEELFVESRRDECPDANRRTKGELTSGQQSTEDLECSSKYSEGGHLECREGNSSDNGTTQFNRLHNKTNHGNKKGVTNGESNLPLAVPAFSPVIDTSTHFQNIGGDSPYKMLSDGVNTQKQHKKSLATSYNDDSKRSENYLKIDQKRHTNNYPVPGNGHAITSPHLSSSSNSISSATNNYPVPENGHANASPHLSSSSSCRSSAEVASSDTMYFSVSDISLRTQPMPVPPPSRAPPRLSNEKEYPHTRILSSSKSLLGERNSSHPDANEENAHVHKDIMKDNSPSFFDVEVDISSAAAASAAAMREAMELAEAKLRTAKQLMDKKRDIHQNKKKLVHQETIICKEQKLDQALTGKESSENVPAKVKRKEASAPKLTQHFKEKEKVVVFSEEDGQRKQENDMNSSKQSKSEDKSEKWKTNNEYHEMINSEKSEVTLKVSETEHLMKKTKIMTTSCEVKHNENMKDALSCEIGSRTLGNDKVTLLACVHENSNVEGHDSYEEVRKSSESHKFLGQDVRDAPYAGKSVLSFARNENNVNPSEHCKLHFIHDDKQENIKLEAALGTCDDHSFSNISEIHGCKEEGTEEKGKPEVDMHLGEKLEKEINIAELTFDPSNDVGKLNVTNATTVQLETETETEVPHLSCTLKIEKIEGDCKCTDSEDDWMDEKQHNAQNLNQFRRKEGVYEQVRSEELTVKPQLPLSAENEFRLKAEQEANSIEENLREREPTVGESRETTSNKQVKLMKTTEAVCWQDCNENRAKEAQFDAQQTEKKENNTPESCNLEKNEGYEINENDLGHGNDGMIEIQFEPHFMEKIISMDAIPVLCKRPLSMPLDLQPANLSGERSGMPIITTKCHPLASQKYVSDIKKKEQKEMERKETERQQNEKSERRVEEEKRKKIIQEEEKTKLLEERTHVLRKLEEDIETARSLEEAKRKERKLEEEEEGASLLEANERERKLKEEQASVLKESKEREQKFEEVKEHARSLEIRESEKQVKEEHAMISQEEKERESLPKEVKENKRNIEDEKTKLHTEEVKEQERISQEEDRERLSKEAKENKQKLEDETAKLHTQEAKEKERKLVERREIVIPIEEEKEREREREKDRVAVERAIREAHERAFAEAKERAERIAAERVTSEAWQRAFKESQIKDKKASSETLPKSTDRASREARLRAERAAVERATAEARERAVERALAEKAAADAREQAQRYNSTSVDRTRKDTLTEEHLKALEKDGPHDARYQSTCSLSSYQARSTSNNQLGEGESVLRYKARLERHQRIAERAAKALAEKNMRDNLAQQEQAERNRLADYLDSDIKRWSNGKEGNLRALLSTLHYILGTESDWQPIPLTDVITASAIKKAYRKATLYVHPDKVQQRGARATIQQKYICEKVFDLLKEAWNRYNSEER